MNYADIDVPYTRIHEPRHLHPERNYPPHKTVIFYETSCDNPNEPYYPMNLEPDRRILSKYRKLASKERNLVIGGRLGDYAYYDIDVTIRHALECFRKHCR
jgi:UDP-galactopyranose mutase